MRGGIYRAVHVCNIYMNSVYMNFVLALLIFFSGYGPLLDLRVTEDGFYIDPKLTVYCSG